MGAKQQDKFDLVVTHRDAKSGAVISSNPYLMTVIQTENGRMRLFERPPGSGNLYDKNNLPVGRWKYEDDGKGKKKKIFDEGAEHVAYQKPETKDQKLARTVLEKEAEIAELKKALAAKEVAAIKAENKSGSDSDEKSDKHSKKDGGGKKA